MDLYPPGRPPDSVTRFASLPRRFHAIAGNSSRMSAALSTSFAPCLIRAWQPRDVGEWIDPGIANTSRPASAARRAVMSEPDRTAASTTSVPRARPAMMRFLIGKFSGSAVVPIANSLTTSPFGGDPPREGAVACRIDDVEPRADHRDRAGAAGERALVRRGVDAERQPRDDDPAGLAQMRSEGARVLEPLRCRVAAADDRDHRRLQAARCGRAHRAAAADRRCRAGLRDSADRR